MSEANVPVPSEIGGQARLEQRYAPAAETPAGRPPERMAPGMSSAALWNWKGIAYALVLGFACLLLVPLTDLWWIVPLLGAATPLTVMMAASRGRGHDGAEQQRAELLAAVATRGMLTPLDAARFTSCTAVEAAHLMDMLASEGALTRIPAGNLPLTAATVAPPAALTLGEEAFTTNSPPAEPDVIAPFALEEPLSDRELQVLTLLAAGRTNAEAARNLFISVGTVKSHTGNIYRKLGAKNRTEAIARARQAGLLS